LLEGVVTHAAPHDAVFIHGAGENCTLWTQILQHLSGGGTAYAVNLPGHPTGEISCHTIDEYSDAVFSFIADHRLGPALCGHSMGGAVGLTLALNHPESVSGLALLSSGAKLGVIPELISGLEKDPLKAIEHDITPLSFYKLDLETGRRARAALSLSNPDVFLNDYLACRAFDARGRLRELSVKTLIVCGRDDRLTPPKWSAYLDANILSPHDLYVVKEAGHMLPIEKPEICARLIQRFLTGLNR